MKLDLMKKIISRVVDNSPIIIIFVLSAIPVLFTWNRLAIGGDVLMPFSIEGLDKYLYQWIGLKNGQYFSINYYPFYLLYWLGSIFNANAYFMSSALLFFLNMVAGFGIYKLVNLFSKDSNGILPLVPVTFYLLSPALFNGCHYLFSYAFAPWFVYYAFKIVIKKELLFFDIFAISIIVAFSSLELPNPKYIFHLFLIFLLTVVLGLFFKLVDRKFVAGLARKLVLAVFLSVYILLPLAYFAMNYSPNEYGVHVKDGYKDKGKMMNYGIDTMDKVLKLHQDFIFLNNVEAERYNQSKWILVLSYVFIILLLIKLLILRKKEIKERKEELIVWVLLSVYFLFSVGPNKPSGFLYEYMVVNFNLLAFLRTTAGAVFYMSLFYALLLFLLVSQIEKNRKVFVAGIISVIMLVGYPFLNGEYYQNFNNVNEYTDRTQHGFKIPDEYFKIKKHIDLKKIDSKLLTPQSDLTYLDTTWGFFGPILYNFLYTSHNIGYGDMYSNIFNHNVGLVLKDNSLREDKRALNVEGTKEIIKYEFLELFSVDMNNFLPHFYVPKNSIISQRTIEGLPRIISQDNWNIRSAVFLERQNLGKSNKLESLSSEKGEIATDSPRNDRTLEFRKINPTKYRVRVHGASGVFPVVFSESFHEGWKAYLTSSNNFKLPTLPTGRQVLNFKSNLNDQILNYKTLDGNSDDQASKEELQDYINKGYITDLGDNKEREIEHKKWNSEKQKEELDYVEKYSVDFVSKNFQGTIQNDNLPEGSIFETWFKKSVDDQNHLMVNGYANSWVVDVNEACGSRSLDGVYARVTGARDDTFCVENADGTYDMEIVVEFWPQRLFYVGAGISGATLLACLGYLAYDWRRKQKKAKIIKANN